MKFIDIYFALRVLILGGGAMLVLVEVDTEFNYLKCTQTRHVDKIPMAANRSGGGNSLSGNFHTKTQNVKLVKDESMPFRIITNRLLVAMYRILL